MNDHVCSHETELLAALESGRWPDACASDLREHVSGCSECNELALVVDALGHDRHGGEAAATVPPSGAVWWRMQMRAEREMRQAAANTARRVHSVFVAATVGALVLVLAMTSLLRDGWAWFVAALPNASELAMLLPAVPSGMTLVLLALAFAVFTPVALYLAVAEE